MKGATLIVGKENSNIETYQLLIGNRLNNTAYYSQINHETFLDGLSEEFSQKILNYGKKVQLNLLNGQKLDTKTGERIKIEKLEQNIIDVFSDKLFEKLKESLGQNGMVIPAGGLN